MEYTSDKIGRTTAIGNATGLSQSSFATGISYRAFGGVKSMTYSTGAPTSVSLNYDNRLRLSTFEAESSANAVDIQNKIYTYTDDGSIKQATNAVDSDYSQTYAYDFAARLKKNDVGGLGTSTPGTRYKQTLGYDAFDNFASRQTWDGGTYRGFTNAVYADNRKTSGGFDGGVDAYDAAGNIVGNTRSYPDVTHWKFDVAGRVADWDETSYYLGTTKWDQGEAITFDGDGRAAKREKRSRIYAFPATGWSYESEYYITSSVTGQALQLDENGNREKMSIHMGTAVIAEHSVDGVAFKHTDPVTGSEMQTTSSGEIEPGDFGRIEREPLGAVLPTTEPELNGSPHNYKTGGTITNPAMCSGKEQEGQGRLGPMPCKPSQAFTNYLTDVYGFDAVSENFQPDVGLGGGGVGADNEPLERRRIRGLSLVRDRNGFAIRGFDFRVSWVLSPFVDDGNGNDDLGGQNPCARMAARAQKVAGEAIEWAKKNKTTYAAALPIFDTSFAPYYIGQIWTGDKDNRDYFERTGGGVPTTARNPKDYGQQDFKEEFLDADATRYTPATDKWGNIYDKAGNPIDGIDFRADQVHHFVAHFSAGINGAYWSSTGQKVSDRLSFNRGDRALTDAAYKMGQALKNNPRDLLTIGNTIRKEICN